MMFCGMIKHRTTIRKIKYSLLKGTSWVWVSTRIRFYKQTRQKNMYKFITKLGKSFEIDLSKWKIDEECRSCKIIDIHNGNLLLENIYKDRFSLPVKLLRANELEIADDKVELTKGLYESYFLKKFKANSVKALDMLYSKHAPVIFKNRNLVLNKAEYYLIKPSLLSTGFLYTGGIGFSLGKLFESFESGNHIYYDVFCGYRKMYLVSMAASRISGTIFSAIFWSDESNEFVSMTNQKHDFKPQLPSDYGTSDGKDLMKMLGGKELAIDRQDRAIENLIDEINLLQV
jgi:hypothetical protein